MTGILAGMLMETGQAMQRGGLRLLGKHVIQPEKFVSIGTKLPSVSRTAVVEPSATIIGDVKVKHRASIGEGAVLRGDVNQVFIGSEAVIGENVVITAQNDRSLTGLPPFARVGALSTIGANSILQSCEIRHSATVGEGCVIGEGAVVESGAVVEANTVVPPGSLISGNQRWGGNPAAPLGPVEEAH